MALTDTSSKSQTLFNFDTERFLEMVAAEIKSELLESPTNASTSGVQCPRTTFTGTPEGSSSQNLQTTLVKRECVEDPNYQELGFSSTPPALMRYSEVKSSLTCPTKLERVEDARFKSGIFESTPRTLSGNSNNTISTPQKVHSYSHTTNKKQHEITQPLSVKKTWENHPDTKMPQKLNLDALKHSDAPFMKGCISVDNGSHILRGLWALSSEVFEGNGVKSEFKYELTSSKTEVPESGTYKGYFKITKMNGRTETWYDRKMFLRFEKYDENNYNVKGSGSNEFGVYILKGHFSTTLDMYRTYVGSYDDIPSEYRPFKAAGKENKNHTPKKKSLSSQVSYPAPKRRNKSVENKNNPFPEWVRLVTFREVVVQGKTGDVYFFSPDGFKMRSRPDIIKYYTSRNMDPELYLPHFKWNTTFCVCGTKDLDEETMVTCQLGAGGCHGFVHPACVQQDRRTKACRESLHFICADCEQYCDNVLVALKVTSNSSLAQPNSTFILQNTVNCKSDTELQQSTNSLKHSNEEDKNQLMVKYDLPVPLHQEHYVKVKLEPNI